MAQLTNAIRKDIRSLEKVKSRRELGLFVAEGTKCVLDTIDYFECKYLIATKQWLEAHAVAVQQDRIYPLSHGEMERVSRLQSVPEVIAVYRIPENIKPSTLGEDDLVVALDCVQDPGNLGTIIRVCDWMGVKNIVASSDTADMYNPKVVQSTMGSIARVTIHYFDNLAGYLHTRANKNIPIYGTFLSGKSIYNNDLAANGIIVMGNEGRGISDAVAREVTQRLLIPSYPSCSATAESLNVAIATAITLSEFRRRLQ